MASKMLFYSFNQRFNEIFGYLDLACSCVLPVFVCKNFYQLFPVKGNLVYSASSPIKSILSLDFSIRFKMVEFAEEVKKQGDNSFIKFLNKT